MYCKKCGEKLEQGDKFCNNCGQDQLAITINEESENNNLLGSEYRNNNIDDIENESELVSSDDPQIAPFKKESFFKKIFKGVGVGGLVVGGGFFYVSLIILRFLFVAFAGLSMIGLAISLFSEGSIIWGLIVLFIGTPIAIGLASYCFIFFLILAIFALIIWGIIYIFGFNVSFVSVWDGIWLVVKILILGSMAFLMISSFIEAIKNKDIVSFFKENWFYILIFFFLFWLFF
jgi:hypothetical protein